MNYIDFNPKPFVGTNTNGAHMVYEMLENRDSSWLTQGTHSVLTWASPCGNGYYQGVAEAMKTRGKDDDIEMLKTTEEQIRNVCRAVVGYIKRDYDVTLKQSVANERTVTIEVPKERKVGLFKKETYMEKETKKEKYYTEEFYTYKGWRIERLLRQEGSGRNAETMFFDYCLGDDGNLYCVVSEDENLSSSRVLQCVYYSPFFLRNKFCNVYSTAISGVLGALDTISMNSEDISRRQHLYLDDDYYYNFPIQLDSINESPFVYPHGIIKRIINLLDADGKDACRKQHEWIIEHF